MQSRRGSFIPIVAAVFIAAGFAAAPAAQSPGMGVDARPSVVEVQLVEQTACLLDAESFLVSFLIHTSYPNGADASLSLALSRERVSRMVFAPDRASLATGQGVRVFVEAGQAPTSAPGHVVTVAPGWTVAGRVLTWVPVSIGTVPAPGALAPGDYVAQLSLDVEGRVESTKAGDSAPALVRYRAVTRPLAIHIPTPRQEQECGSAVVPLRVVDVS